MPFCYQHPKYWQVIAQETKQTGSMIASRKLFADSQVAHPIKEDEFIKVENIKGRLLVIGAEDDLLWDTAKYIHRIEKRLADISHDCRLETVVYKHATHFVFPESMIKKMLPIGSSLFVSIAFPNSKKYKAECKAARVDIDRRVTSAITQWKNDK